MYLSNRNSKNINSASPAEILFRSGRFCPLRHKTSLLWFRRVSVSPGIDVAQGSITQRNSKCIEIH